MIFVLASRLILSYGKQNPSKVDGFHFRWFCSRWRNTLYIRKMKMISQGLLDTLLHFIEMPMMIGILLLAGHLHAIFSPCYEFKYSMIPLFHCIRALFLNCSIHQHQGEPHIFISLYPSQCCINVCHLRGRESEDWTWKSEMKLKHIYSMSWARSVNRIVSWIGIGLFLPKKIFLHKVTDIQIINHCFLFNTVCIYRYALSQIITTVITDDWWKIYRIPAARWKHFWKCFLHVRNFFMKNIVWTWYQTPSRIGFERIFH